MQKAFTEYLQRHPTWLAVVASWSSFSTYFFVYAFRKPYTAATYTTHEAVGSVIGQHADLKTTFIIAQVLGYGISKFAGTKFCSEVPRERLWHALAGSILLSWLALLLFAVLPPPLKVVAIFFNGLPLGMAWGFVVRQLEGRRISEILLAALSCSFILANGEVKRVGGWLLEAGITEYWMPFLVGAIFVIPFLASSAILSWLPAPNLDDEAFRSKRETMDPQSRRAFVKRFLPGLIPICIAYLLLTSYRDFRDNYQAELFDGLGISDPNAFVRTERPIAFGVMLVMALLFTIRNNRMGLAATYLVMVSGIAVMGGSTWFHDQRLISGETWMILTGLGVYLAYVPFGSVLFDRTIAVTRFAGTAVFAIYVADALGYTGSAVLQLARDLFSLGSSRVEFFRDFTYAIAIGGVPLILLAMTYFLRQKPPEDS